VTDQGAIYLTFVENELKAERDRRANYDGRGQALVATSSVLVTLVSGGFAVVGTKTVTRTPPLVVGILLLALALFVLSAVLGIVAGWNRHYAVAKYETIDRMLGEHWADNAVDARNNVATIHANTIRALRISNHFKATCVSYGLIFQVLALLTFAVGVAMLLGQAGS
jgi:hypothetical protein